MVNTQEKNIKAFFSVSVTNLSCNPKLYTVIDTTKMFQVNSESTAYDAVSLSALFTLKPWIVIYLVVCSACSFVMSSCLLWERKTDSSSAGDGQMAAWRLWGRLPPLGSLRAAFIVQLETGWSTCNHLVQVWASLCCFGHGKPLIGCQSIVLWSQHCSSYIA